MPGTNNASYPGAKVPRVTPRQNKRSLPGLGTINRLWLRNQISAGNIEAKCDGEYTDDYFLDASVNYGKTDWRPTRIALEGERHAGRPPGQITFDMDDFRGCGRAWGDKAGTMVLSFGYKSYSLRAKQAVTVDALVLDKNAA